MWQKLITHFYFPSFPAHREGRVKFKKGIKRNIANSYINVSTDTTGSREHTG